MTVEERIERLERRVTPAHGSPLTGARGSDVRCRIANGGSGEEVHEVSGRHEQC